MVWKTPGRFGSRRCSCFTMTSKRAAERFFLAILDLSRPQGAVIGRHPCHPAPIKPKWAGAGPKRASANRIEIKVQVTPSQADALMNDFSAQSTHLPQQARSPGNVQRE